MAGRTPIGKFIHNVWGNLNVRCCNGKYHDRYGKQNKKNKCYRGVEIRMSYGDFKSWCYNHQSDILALSRPSIDRIDSSGHYSIDNITVAELSVNCAREKTNLVDGTLPCYVCGRRLPLTAFYRNNRNKTHGRETECKECQSERKRLA